MKSVWKENDPCSVRGAFCYNQGSMKMNYLKKYSFLLILLLAACALPPKESPEVAQQKMATQLQALPGAVVNAENLQISYPVGSLFAEGSVLPLPGGMEMLDPLIDLLIYNPQFEVNGIIRSSGHEEQHDLLLAGKRLELLQTIFQNRGLDAGRLQWKMAAGAGAPLELQFQPASAATSSGEKR
jgi:hypothetical protein